ncbi:hypothetical protein ABPG75_010989 [Micractinium tetrahymenae]
MGNVTYAIENVPPGVLLSGLDSAVAKFRSALLYHFSLEAALSPEELEVAGTIPTALPGYTLTFKFDNSTGAFAVTDASGAVAKVLDDAVSACGSELYIIDRVLLPAPLPDIPDTPRGTAVGDLGGSSTTAAAPSPAA